ncbi:MAG: hypothetical protein HQL29_01840 [Candidatus Omnitrophica bacterium]|nr:hypothetical protein [Candidatus Omnitrophota bacterium]
MKDAIVKVLWTIFAWLFGLLFIVGGISNIFDPMYPDRQPIFGIQYNYAIALGGIIVGYLIIRGWFKHYVGKKQE